MGGGKKGRRGAFYTRGVTVDEVHPSQLGKTQFSTGACADSQCGFAVNAPGYHTTKSHKEGRAEAVSISYSRRYLEVQLLPRLPVGLFPSHSQSMERSAGYKRA